MRAERQTIDLRAYPDQVVIYLGMRVRRPRGALTLFGLGPQIQKSWKAKPDGLLLHEDSSGHCFLFTWACGSTGVTLTVSNAGPAANRTDGGGGSSAA